MTHDPELFPVLDPPPGGRARLRAALDAPPVHVGHRALVAVLAVAAALALGWAFDAGRSPPIAPVPEPEPVADLLRGVDHPSLVGWGRRPVPAEPVVVRSGDGEGPAILERIPTARDDVVLYRVTSADAGPDAPE